MCCLLSVTYRLYILRWHSQPLLQREDFVGDSLQILADGSKLNKTISGSLFNMSIRLPDHSNVLQAEVSMIWAAVETIRIMQISTADSTILSDSQSIFKALSPGKFVYRRCLNELAERFSVHVIWILGHSSFSRICRVANLPDWATSFSLRANFPRWVSP